MPSKDDVIAFIEASPSRVSRRDIARQFGIRGDNRRLLKAMLNELADAGHLSGSKKELRKRGALPPVTVLSIHMIDDDGDLIAEPVQWDQAEGVRPRARVVSDKRSRHTPDLGIGDRILARIAPANDSGNAATDVPYEARTIRKLPKADRGYLGIFRDARKGRGGTIDPVDRKQLKTWRIAPDHQGDATDGDLVRFAFEKTGRHKIPSARVTETLGNPQAQQQISLIAVHAHGLPDQFPEAVLKETDKLRAVTKGNRVDLRDVPLITIDPADARDHDDAVYAQADDHPNNPGGYVVTVAIADVAHYVKPGTRLDREARLRANSTYFPDRVVPMLPERISNDLCSLRAHEDRPCLAVEMVFDKSGQKKHHRFVRALMRSHAKLSYQQAQAAFDGRPEHDHEALCTTVLEPLHQAYQTILRARQKRSPLELELPERKIVLDKQGRVDRVITPERLTAHKLIEEFMIQANVAAAETLERAKTPLIYRVHEPPSKEKVEALQDFLQTLAIKIPPGSDLTPRALNAVLEKAEQLPSKDLVHEMILRSQSQAEYAIENRGHFGLNLARYAHFTSPIRRYADLIVHRALIRALNLGDDGLTKEQGGELAAIARSISDTERRTMAAERETVDRLISAHLADRIGAEFQARVAGVTRAGLFVRLRETGADGFVPISTLDGGYYDFIEAAMALIDTASGLSYRLGDDVDVRLVEAIPTAGALRFEMLSPGRKRKLGIKQSARPRRGRGKPKSRHTKTKSRKKQRRH